MKKKYGTNWQPPRGSPGCYVSSFFERGNIVCFIIQIHAKLVILQYACHVKKLTVKKCLHDNLNYEA